jgi:hypothetical protein
MTLLELADRCEQGHADYQRTLLSDAAYAVFGDEADHRDDPTFWPRATDFVAKLRAQAYLDAALALVPEGVNWSVGRNGTAAVGKNIVAAATPALAVCVGALRERAS